MDIHISVRNLVEFILRSGDIDNRKAVAPENAMQEGSRIHRMIQRRMGSDYHAEVSLQYLYETENYRILIDGRADGIIDATESNGNMVTIDEIKGTYREIHRIKEAQQVHLAQASCYAYFYAKQQELSAIRIRITYCNMETEELREEILSRWCSRSPYTYFHLQDWLDGCVGAGNYIGTLERESYRLRLVLELCVKEKREFLQKHLRKIIPANLVLQVNLNVNTHGKLHRIRHGEMKEKGLTYGGIPFEILPEEEGNSAVSGKKLLQRMRGCATIQK